MRDIVLQGFITSFAESQGMSESDDATVFEAFAVSSILRKYHQSDSSGLEDFLTGGTGDAGIDAVAILVNGHPARIDGDVDFFVERLRRLDVEFVFIQAKTSPTFEAASIGTFVHGVTQFFAEKQTPPFREDLERVRKLKDYVYAKGIAMEHNPRCCLYYVSSGKWQDAPEPRARMEDGKQRLADLNLFSEVNVLPVDAERLKTIYRELERVVVKEVELSKTVVFPRIDGVSEAYIGLLSGDQFMHLVATEEDYLNRELFYDNVRDFQGNNPVNKEIAQTIGDATARIRFPLLNNGVTIVARSINRTGDTFKISDFQVVNGCQTTHILFQNRSAVDKSVYVPVKLVVTDDSQVISEVIKATNRQTAVLPESLESLTPFHKELEDFYSVQHAGVAKDDRVYYERRSKQYSFDRIKATNIVTLTAQTKSFVGMFLNEPHSHPRYYGELLKSYEPRLFVADHKPAPYYASGRSLLAAEALFNSGQLDRGMKRWKYHLLMLLRIQIAGFDVPRLNSKGATAYAMAIADALKDRERFRDNCVTALQTIRNQLKSFSARVPEHPSRLRAFTLKLLDAAQVVPSPKPSNVRGDRPKPEPKPHLGAEETGTILWFDDWKSFGFIVRDGGGDIFVHRTGLDAVPWHLRTEGTRVKYKVAQGPSTLKAEEVMIVKS